MKIYLFTVASLDLVGYVRSSDLSEGLTPSVSNQVSNTEQKEDQKIQELFKKYLDVKDKIFNHILNDEEDLNKLDHYVLNINKISFEIANAYPDAESNPISRIMKSYIDSKQQENMRLLFLNISVENKKGFLAYDKITQRFKYHMGLYLLATDAMAKKLNNSNEIFNRDYIKHIRIYCGISEDEIAFLERSDIQEITKRTEEYRLDNLKDIFLLMHFKNALLRTKSDSKNANTFLNFVIWQSILLDYKFGMIVPSKLGADEMIKSLFSDLKESYSLLCAYFFRYLSTKSGLHRKIMNGKEEFLPIKQLLCFLPDDRKMSKYFEISDDLENSLSFFKYYICTIAAKVRYDFKLLELLKTLNMGAIEAAERYDELKRRLDELFYCLNKFEILSLSPAESSERLKENLFLKFASEIDILMDNLEEFAPKKVLENLLAEKIQSALKISESESKALSSELFASMPKMISKYLKNEFENFFSTITAAPNDERTKDQLLDTLRLKIRELSSKRPIRLGNLDIRLELHKQKLEERNNFPSTAEKGILEKLKDDFKDLSRSEQARESEYLNSMKAAKSFLFDILLFSPSRSKITEMNEDSPYENRIQFCDDSIKWIDNLFASLEDYDFDFDHDSDEEDSDDESEGTRV